MEQRAREGDFLETHEGLIFDVKGLIHPPERIIAFLRYYPDPAGNRIRDGIRYKKVYSLEDRYEFLKENYPQYSFNDEVSGELLQGVPLENIKKVYHPADFVRILRQDEEDTDLKKHSSITQKAYEFIKLIHSYSNVNFEYMGITGSSLVNLETEQSDIDLIIYGMNNALHVRKAVSSLHKSRFDIVRPYSEKNIGGLYKFRGKNSNLTYEEFLKIEQRKILQGLFKGLDYYIRCIKDWNEISYRKVQYKSVGISTISGIVIDDTESVFTPCKYLIDKVNIIKGVKFTDPIQEIMSFRGRFCEQARKGEEFEARGKIELVRTDEDKYLHLLIGSNKEDYFRVLNL